MPEQPDHTCLSARVALARKVVEPLKGSKDMASLLAYTRKKKFGWRFLVSGVITGGLSGHLGPGPKLLDDISLKLLLETRLKSNS